MVSVQVFLFSPAQELALSLGPELVLSAWEESLVSSGLDLELFVLSFSFTPFHAFLR